VGIEEYLVILLRVSTQQKCTAEAQLEPAHVELTALTTDHYPAITPVELVSVARGELQCTNVPQLVTRPVS
jgi:hypothetical protein